MYKIEEVGLPPMFELALATVALIARERELVSRMNMVDVDLFVRIKVNVVQLTSRKHQNKIFQNRYVYDTIL